MQLKLKEMDQSQWVCYEFPDNSYYYGETAYLDDAGNIHSKDSLEISTNPKATLVKHGFGIYVYKKKEGSVAIRYEGQWERDKKNKLGKMFYEDGSVYTGGWKQDQRSDTGKMQWPDGSSYEGNWRRDRFQGPGCFKKKNGNELKGMFRCNYFIEHDILRNPFFAEAQTEKFLKARKDVLKLKEKIAKIKVGFFKKVSKLEDAAQLIAESNNNNRVPLIFSAAASHLSLGQFRTDFSATNGKLTCEFDLRKIYTLKHEERGKYRSEIRLALVEMLQHGGLFIINIDESDAAYDQIFYPDIKEFYDSDNFPPQIWSRKEVLRLGFQMEKKEVHGSLSGGISAVHKEFQVVAWTKHRLDSTANEKIILQQLQKRFDSVLPLVKVDYIMLIL